QLKYKQTGTEPSGALAHHNTFVSARRALDLQTPVTTHHFRIVNNLFLGPPAPEAGSSVEWTAGVRAGEFDHNGYFPDGRFWFGTVAGRRRVFEHFAAVRQAGEVERHGVLLSASPLASGALGTPDGRRAAPPGTFALRPDSEAVDRGVLLPGLNDRHAGAAPDLGAHELGAEEPWYGPRPEGREHLTNLVNAPPAADGGRTSRRGVTRLPR
ncbi:MAG TPA: hypothetical protein PKE47_12780, partial [Verrucomicrobiota bacterium]|nr:hypothetical protein [Verrucomicrobiota bacterium]